MFEINGNTYTQADLMDSIMDGVCSSCGETSPRALVSAWCM